jgi:hypothetical protein
MDLLPVGRAPDSLGARPGSIPDLRVGGAIGYVSGVGDEGRDADQRSVPGGVEAVVIATSAASR